MAEFVHLHNHSEYSLLDGMLRLSEKGPSRFLKSVAAGGMKAMALTDHGNMYGAMEFYKNAAAAGLKPIIGCEAYITDGKYTNKEKGLARTFHVTLLAKDYGGYQNLMRLISKAWLDGFYYHPRIDKELLAQHAQGIMALSGCLKGEVSQACLGGTISQACETAKAYENILGKGNYYIELMDHGIDDEQLVLPKLLEVSKLTGIPVVATNDCHYEKKEDWSAHDIHLCISTGKTLDDPSRMKMTTHELYFKSADEMAQLFSHTPEAIKNTLEVAEKCNFTLPKHGFILPVFDIPPGYKNIETYLTQMCEEGLAKKFPDGKIPQDYKERLNYELGVISKMGFASYFLIVADFIDYARHHEVPVGPGRGSGAGSIVAYSLNITKVDPITNGLIFERFLNPDRLTMPDLDIDFSDAGRDAVIEYVRNKYGQTNVAQIITFGTMKAKMAVKDVARAMGISVADSNRITKLIPNDLGTTLDSAIADVKDLRQEIASNPQTAKLFDYAKKLEGLKRHAGIHAAGIVVTREEVSNYTPLARGARDAVTTQYEGETLVDLGLLKIDFLGLRTLTIIENTVKLLKEMRGIDIDIDKIPLDDKKAYELLSSARTLGVFQIESGGIRDLAKRMHASQFTDISAIIALYRPGPMESGMLDSFVRRKAGQEKITYDHPLLEPILKETYGTMVYQEQIMEISRSLGGFTLAQADSLRKAMGKKKHDEMEKWRQSFVKGCGEKHINAKLADKIFEQMSKFAGYGFNKSHSVAYALVSYQTAYLKANYPVEFMCAVLTNEIGHNAIGSDDKENKIVTYIDEARRMGFETLGPDVNASKENFSVAEENGKEALRFGLEAVKNVGSEPAASIVAARAGKPYKNFEDLLERIDLRAANKKTIESLIKAGALDSLMPGVSPAAARAQMLAETEDLLDVTSKLKEEKLTAADSLFGEDTASFVTVKKAAVKTKPRPFTQAEMLDAEKEVLGFFLSGHPLDKYKNIIEKLKTATVQEINDKNLSGAVTITGIITRVKKRQNKRKEDWAQFTLEDQTGGITANAYSRVYAEVAEKIENNAIVFLAGDIKTDAESARTEIMVNGINTIVNAVSRVAKKLIINIPANYSETNLRQLESLLERGKGATEVYFSVADEKGGAPFSVRTKHNIVIHKPLIDFIENTIGPGCWDFER